MSPITSTLKRTALPIVVIGGAVFFGLYYLNDGGATASKDAVSAIRSDSNSDSDQATELNDSQLKLLSQELASANREIADLKNQIAALRTHQPTSDNCTTETTPSLNRVPITGSDPTLPLELPTEIVEACAIDSMLDDDSLLNLSHLEMLALQGSTEGTRLQAIAGLSQVSDAEHLPLMDEIARNDPSRAVRAEAMEAALMLGGWDGIDTAVNVLANDSDTHVANRAMRALEELGNRGNTNVTSYLENAYANARGGRAFNIARTLDRLGAPGSLEQEKAKLSNTALNGITTPGRITAIRRLASAADSADLALLQSIANDEDAPPRVRAEARKAVSSEDD